MGEYDVSYKVLLLGDSAVGKTSMMKCLMDETFNSVHTAPTCGVDLIQKTFTIQGVRVRLDIWDTGGQERYRSITNASFRGIQGVIMVYAITDKRSFDSIAYWLKMTELEIEDGKNVSVFLVANKTDLEEKRVVSKTQGEQKVNESPLVHSFLETSVKAKPHAVYRIFEDMARMLVSRHDLERMIFLTQSGDYGTASSTLKLNTKEKKREKRRCCHR